MHVQVLQRSDRTFVTIFENTPEPVSQEEAEFYARQYWSEEEQERSSIRSSVESPSAIRSKPAISGSYLRTVVALEHWRNAALCVIALNILLIVALVRATH